jgi:uncharacterized protein YsxB (DUF464 family)
VSVFLPVTEGSPAATAGEERAGLGIRPAGYVYKEDEQAMIHIEMNTARFKLTAEGHAQPEESTQYKEICAGVSAIVQGLVYSISKFKGDKDALTYYKYRDEPGNMLLKAVPEEWAEISMTRRVSYFGDALEMMATAHPQCIEFIWDGEKILKEDDGNE